MNPPTGYDAKVLHVLIASPGDVDEERQTIEDLMTRWNRFNSEEYGTILLPRRWEIDVTPELGERTQGVINRQIVDRCHILIGVFWSRLGTPTTVAEGGAVEEIERFVSTGRPVLLFFSSRDLPNDADTRQVDALRAYKKRIQPQGVTRDYKTIEALKEMVYDHMTPTVKRVRDGSPSASPSTSALPGDPADKGQRAPVDVSHQTRQAVSTHPDKEIAPPREQPKNVELSAVPPILMELAGLVLNEIAEEEHREWPRIRWKTIYTINLRRRLRHPLPDWVPDTLIQLVRSSGAAMASTLLSGNREDFDAFKDGRGTAKELAPAWFVDRLQPMDFGPHATAKPWADRLPAGIEPEAIRKVGASELARIFLCEILVYAFVHLGLGSRAARKTELNRAFGNDLSPLSAIARELLVYNGLRAIDSLQVTPPPDAETIAPHRILGFLWPDGRTCAAELDYLVRWPHQMDVVVLTDDSAKAKFGSFGPFTNKRPLDESYRSFIKSGHGRGVSLVIANFADLQLGKRRVAAWRLEKDKWARSSIYSEFFYDKFPTNVQTILLKDQMAKDPRIVIWNKVVFTELLANKHQSASLLENYKVPVVGPTRHLPSESTRGKRQSLLDDLTADMAAAGVERAPDNRWVVVKPLTGWGGTGVARMTPDEFLDADFRNAPYDEFAGVVVQPFFESAVSIPELGITGRHDVRVVFVGSRPVFGMIRELPATADAFVASLKNIKQYGGNRRYLDIDAVTQRQDAAELVSQVPETLGKVFGSTPAVYSVDFFWVKKAESIIPMVVELNSKPSQVWEPDDPVGRQVITRFHDEIVRELSAFHDEQEASAP